MACIRWNWGPRRGSGNLQTKSVSLDGRRGRTVGPSPNQGRRREDLSKNRVTHHVRFRSYNRNDTSSVFVGRENGVYVSVCPEPDSRVPGKRGSWDQSYDSWNVLKEVHEHKSGTVEGYVLPNSSMGKRSTVLVPCFSNSLHAFSVSTFHFLKPKLELEGLTSLKRGVRRQLTIGVL